MAGFKSYLKLGIALGMFGFVLFLVQPQIILFKHNLEAPRAEEPGTYSIQLDLSTPQYSLEKSADGSDLIQVEGYKPIADANGYLLPGRAYVLALPPDADLDSLELVVDDIQTASLPGTFTPQVEQPWESSCSTDGAYNPSTSESNVSSASTNLSYVTGDLLAPEPALVYPPKYADQALTLTHPGQMRKWRFASLVYAPFIYDPGDGSLRQVTSLRARLLYKLDPAVRASPDYPLLMQDSVMDDIAEKIFDNFETANRWYADAAESYKPSQPASETYDYVIITTNYIKNNSAMLESFKQHKQNQGYHVLIVTEDTFNNYHGPPPDGVAERIRAYLQQNYISLGIKFVLLIGNPQPYTPVYLGGIPMKQCWPRLFEILDPDNMDADTDYYYAGLHGSWNEGPDGYYCDLMDWVDNAVDLAPDVYVGRIPVYGTPPDYATLDKILKKTIDYQHGLYAGDWQNRALLPMCYQKTNYDGAALGQQMIHDYLGFHMNTWTMYEQGGGACPQNDSGAPSDQELLHSSDVVLRWAVDDYGLVVWWGHGNSQSTIIGYSVLGGENCEDGYILQQADTPILDDRHPAIVYQNSCNNGDPDDPYNLQYALLKNGAVATVGATRVSWFTTEQDYGEFQASMTNAGIAYEFAHLLTLYPSFYSVGEALYDGKFFVYLFDSNLLPHADRFMNMLVFNLYGDPSTKLGYSASVPPLAPSNLKIESYDPVHQRVNLSWKDNSEIETTFVVERSVHSTYHWESEATEWQDTITHSAYYGDACWTDIYYRVKACNNFGCSDPSNTVLSQYTNGVCPPDPVTDMNAQVTQPREVTINWVYHGTSHAYNFRVERADYPGWDWEPIATIKNVTGGSYVDSNLECNKPYRYIVIAFNEAGDSKPGATTVLLEDVCPPNAVSDFSATASPVSDQVLLEWNDNSSTEDGFKIHRWRTGEGWQLIQTLPENSSSHIQYWDNDVDCGTIFYYRIEIFNDIGSQTSDHQSILTRTCAVPAVPSDLVAGADWIFKTSIQLSWTDNSNNELAFIIERSPNGVDNWVVYGNNATGKDETQFLDSGLGCGETYYYRVRAFNGQLSDPSNIAEGYTVCDTNTPGNLTATPASQTQIDLDWDDLSGLATQFDFLRTSNPNKEPWEWIDTAYYSYYQDTGLDSNTTYYYSVRARNPGIPFTSVFSDPISAKTIICTPNTASNVRQITFSSSVAGLIWTDNSDNEEVFNIERSIDGGEFVQAGVTGSNVNNFFDQELECNHNYNYRIHARNSGGSSSYSYLSISLPCSPEPPSNLRVVIESRPEIDDHLGAPKASLDTAPIQIGWDDQSDDELGFIVQRLAASEIQWLTVATLDPDTDRYLDEDIVCGRDYSYRVMAFNDGGYSDVGDVLQAASQACVPVLSVQALSQSAIGLSWTDGSQNETGFKVWRLSGGSWDIIAELNPDVIHYHDTDIVCATTYAYMIQVDGPGYGANSDVESALAACQPDGAPSGLTVVGVDIDQAHLEWIDQSSNEDGFIILRSPDANDSWVEVGRVSAGVTAFSDTGLSLNRVYYYRVVAYNGGGQTDFSNLATAEMLKGVFLPLAIK